MKFTFLDPLSKLISRSYCLCCQNSIERQTESCTDTNCFCQQYSIIANQDSLEKYSVRTHTPMVEQKTYMSSVHFIIHCTITYIGQEEEMQLENTKEQSKMKNPEKLARQCTQDEHKQKNPQTQYALDTTLRKQTNKYYIKQNWIQSITINNK